MKKNVMILTGAGQIGMAIARRMGYGMKIVIGDKRRDNAETIAETMNKAGFETVPIEMDLSSRESILELIDSAKHYGEIQMLINAAGVSPSQASIETILHVDLYGTAVLLEEVGKVIAEGGTGVTISSQSGHRLPALGTEIDEQLAIIIRKSKFPQNPKRSVRFSGKRTKRSVQKRKARNTQKAETKVL